MKHFNVHQAYNVSDINNTSISNLSALDGRPLGGRLIRGLSQNGARLTTLKSLELETA